MANKWYVKGNDDLNGKYNVEEFDSFDEAKDALEEYIDDDENLEVLYRDDTLVTFKFYEEGEWFEGCLEVVEE